MYEEQNDPIRLVPELVPMPVFLKERMEENKKKERKTCEFKFT